MEKFTNQEINFVIQKLLKLKDGIDINDLISAKVIINTRNR